MHPTEINIGEIIDNITFPLSKYEIDENGNEYYNNHNDIFERQLIKFLQNSTYGMFFGDE